MEQLYGAITPLLLLATLPGIVQALKVWFKLQDIAANILTFGVAFALALLWQVQAMYGGQFATWFNVVIYTVLFALTGSGYYMLTHPEAKG
jgi:hypothetical protein